MIMIVEAAEREDYINKIRGNYMNKIRVGRIFGKRKRLLICIHRSDNSMLAKISSDIYEVRIVHAQCGTMREEKSNGLDNSLCACFPAHVYNKT